MDETTLISTLQSHLDELVAPPVRTGSQEDSRPVPAVILDDWNTIGQRFHNTSVAGHRYGDLDGDGKPEVDEITRKYYRTNLEYVVLHEDEVAGSKIKDKLVAEFGLLRENPTDLHPHVRTVQADGWGSPSYNLVESKETEYVVSVVIEAFDDIAKRNDEVIRDIEKSYEMQ